jgi:hypothetical protein
LVSEPLAAETLAGEGRVREQVEGSRMREIIYVRRESEGERGKVTETNAVCDKCY